jgi:hypothetical protein
MTPSDEPLSGPDIEVVSRLRSAAAWAESLSWRLEAADVMDGDVMSGAALAPSAPGKTGDWALNKKSRASVRLRPRLVWAALVAAAVVAAIVVPQISSHSHSPLKTGTTSSTGSPSDKGGGTPHAASACTTTVHGVSVNSKGSVVQLPINPGRIVSRTTAISTARRIVTSMTKIAVEGDEVAKLSSWAEVDRLWAPIDPGFSERIFGPGPGTWTPIWAVILSTPPDNAVGEPIQVWYLVAIDAATGTVRLETPIGNPAWFSALSDRDPTLKGCPGGSSARLPFGVLTRDEEAYVIHPGHGPGTKAILTLTTVPALNRVDPGLYGGCVRENCSPDDLVWLTILVYIAAPGHTLACLPPSASYPPGYRPKQVKEYYTVSVIGNGEIGCGKLPSALANLKDLAPPAG